MQYFSELVRGLWRPSSSHASLWNPFSNRSASMTVTNKQLNNILDEDEDRMVDAERDDAAGAEEALHGAMNAPL